jgi:hypothetical protein
VELVYSYDADGTGPGAALDAVVDRQKLPANIVSIETGTATGAHDFAPAWERHDPRLARCIRDRWYDTWVAAGVPPSDNPICKGEVLTPTWGYRNARATTPGSEGDSVYNTIGAVNDADDGDADVFDGNYDVGWSTTERFDDLVEVPNRPAWKFANVGALGKLLCAGPLPANPTAYGWSDPATVDSGDKDFWLIKESPYTAVPTAASATEFQEMPLDSKKVNFTAENVRSLDNPSSIYAPTATESSIATFPTGRATPVA